MWYKRQIASSDTRVLKSSINKLLIIIVLADVWGNNIHALSGINKLSESIRNLVAFKPLVKSLPQREIYPVMNEVSLPTFMRGVYKLNQKAVHLKNFHDNNTRCVLVVGPLGSGKTVLLRRYSKKIVLNKIDNLVNIEIIVFVNIETIPTKKLYLWEFIFEDFCAEIEDKEREPLVRWMHLSENQSKILFIFDNFDISSKLDAVTKMKCKYFQESTPLNFIFNILRGEMFRCCKILMSSRAYGLKYIPDDCKPDKLIVLGRLAQADVHNQIRDTISVCSKKIKIDDVLVDISSNPLTLQNVQYIIYSGEDASLIVILVNMLQSCRESTHKNYIIKLSKLAFQKLGSTRLTFSETELHKLGLSSEYVQDVMFPMPVSSPGVMTWTFEFINKHFHWLFAALFAVSISRDTFGKFLDENFRQNKEVVQMTFSIICNEYNARIVMHNFDNIKPPHVSSKRGFLTEYIKNILIKTKGLIDPLLEFYITSCDKSFQCKVMGKSMEPILKEVINGKLDLDNKNLTKLQIQYLDEALRRNKTTIAPVDVMYASGTNNAVCSSLAKIVCKCQVQEIYMHNSTISVSDLEEFFNGFDDIESDTTTSVGLHQVKMMSLEGNSNIVCGWLAKIISILRLESLKLNDCAINKKALKQFYEKLNYSVDFQLKSLTVNENPEVVGSSLAKIIIKCGVEILYMEHCNTNQINLDQFLDGLGSNDTNNRVNAVSLVGNHGVVCSTLATIIQRCHVARLYLDDCAITRDNLENFCDGYKSNTGQALRISMLHNKFTNGMVEVLEKLMSRVRCTLVLSSQDKYVSEDVKKKLIDAAKRKNVKLEWD